MTTYDTFHVWLQSLAPTRFNSYRQTIIDQLHTALIQCHLNQIPDGSATILLLLDETTTEEQEKECIRETLDHENRIIALYLGEKKMPFFRVWNLLCQGVEDVWHFRDKIGLGKAIQSRLLRWFTIDQVMNSDRVVKTLIGSSQVWRKTLRQVIEIACFSSAPVLVLGESGTGKELIARLIHDLDKRQDKKELVLLDCTTIVPELSGSEFFGHEKGAFTNAVDNRDGAFALADKGTLFLDEIGELPLRLQGELLRVSQEGLYKRVGSNIWKRAQFRLICATNRNLLLEVEKGNFRQDLYYRLSTCVVHLPPLRDRRIDIPELTEHFLANTLQTDKPPIIDPTLMNFLMSHAYPGNVRQLRQMVTRISYRHTGDGPVTIGDIPDADRENLLFAPHGWQENGFKGAIRQALADGIGLKDIKRITAEVAMDIAIEDSAGNLQEAARRLDVTDRLVQGYLAERKGK